jgi:ubiquinone/menaquinone biosynthesis C-methylase UbiE/uncharacterized protein YbaR (Trm112 family)
MAVPEWLSKSGELSVHLKMATRSKHNEQRAAMPICHDARMSEMTTDFVQFLLDPETFSQDLCLEVFEKDESGRVREGRLVNRENGSWYRIEDYIVDLLPPVLRNQERYQRFAARHGLAADSGVKETAELESQRLQIEFFEKDSRVYDNDVSGHPFYRIFDSLYMDPWVRRLPPSLHVLDIGGGTGRQALPLARAGHRVLCTDISEEMLKIAVRKALDAEVIQFIDFILCDAENLPVVSSNFDAAICYGVLHHMANPGRTLAHVGRVLKSAGRWFSVDPHDSLFRWVFDLANRINKIYDELAADEKHFSERELATICSAAGIDVQVTYSTYLLPHLIQVIPYGLAYRVFAFTDALFQRIPLVRKTGGILVVEGTKA